MAPGQTGAERLPLWFIEGMAEYLSLGPVDANTAMWLRDAARKEKLPSIRDLDNPKYFPYRWGQAFWAYVGGRWGDQVVREMLDIGARSGDPRVAIERVLGLNDKELSTDWHAAIRKAYGPLAATTTPPAEAGTLSIKGQKLGGDLNVGPAISPDGRWMAFLSERSLFSIDLFIAETSTGKVVHRLTSTASDPHFSSLQFIYSAGAWAADSRRLAIATVVSGQPTIAIFDAQSGEREREIKITQVDEIFNPTWAPDGHAICFTGMSRGLTDLFVVDMNSGAVRQLTQDAFADLQPAWSPDGSRIAFATDRFSSNLDTLAIGDYRIALIDPETARIEQAGTFTSGKNINPQWSPDSRTVYFIADRDGISNLYRMPVGRGDAEQVTNVLTGLSGITNSSPALSVSSGTGVAAFSVYDDGKYDIYTRRVEPVSSADRAASAIRTPASMDAATLPPLDRRASEVDALLKNPRFGLPEAKSFETASYKPKLKLDALGQPTFAVGANRLGAFVGGGISASFSDMLGDHSLGVALQLNQGISGGFSGRDTAVQAAYLNQARRWNWGVVAGQMPYLSGGIQEDLGTIEGEPSIIDQTIVFRQTERSAAAVVAYPFSRARRIEFQAGGTQIAFDRVVRTQAYSLNTGVLFLDETHTESIANSLSLGNASAAFVSDTSSYGATSPVQGERYRLEAAPTFGTVNFTSLLADYRRYLMPVPFYTLAARILHYGRYGSASEDERFFPLYIGYPTLVRGYDINSIGVDECVPNAVSSCPAFDRLVGSRLLVGNLEFRFPLLRPFTGVSRMMYTPVPVELAVFADGGVAWNRNERPSVLGGDRAGVGSAGVSLRANLFGFAVGQFDVARPFQRPGKGWVFGFSLSPGF
jgi:Tol biopolymer transport system component